MGKCVVAFDAGSSLLKMAVFSAERNRIQLTDFDVSPLSAPVDASLDEKNRLLARQMKANLALKKVKAASVLISISGQSAFTRFVKLPAVEEAKVNQIIRYEAQQQVPFPIDDVEWDHFIIGKTPAGEINIVLVAVKNDIIASFVSECKKAGLDLTVVDVAPLCIYNCLRHTEQEFAECTAVIDFGARGANFIISEGDDLWARTIPIGGDNITAGIAKELNIEYADAEKLKLSVWVPGASGGEPQDATEQQRKAANVVASFTNRMMAELSRSIGFYRSQPGHSAIKRILLCGGSSRLRNFKEFLSDKLKVDVGWLMPLKRVQVAPRIDREQLNQLTDIFAGAVGLGLRGAEMGRIRINLLPKSIARKKELSKKKALLIAAGWLLVASLMLLGFAKKMSHGDNPEAFNRIVSSLNGSIGGILPSGPTYKENAEKLESIFTQDSTMAAKISVIEGQISSMEKKVKAIGVVQDAREYWARFIEALKNTKLEVAGRGKKNYIWVTYLKVTSSQAEMLEYMPELENMPRGMYSVASYRTTTSSSSTRSTGTKRRGPDTRPWVIIRGYVKIPAQMAGDEREATARAEAFMKALEVMGEKLVCSKDHSYREDKDTGYLLPVSADTGPAKAYRYTWDEAKKEVVLEGLAPAASETAEGEETSPTAAEGWQELARYKPRKKPEWIGDRSVQGVNFDIPCPIGLARSGDYRKAKKLSRTDGYLDEVRVRWLELKTEKLARVTIIAKFADNFDYPDKSEML